MKLTLLSKILISIVITSVILLLVKGIRTPLLNSSDDLNTTLLTGAGLSTALTVIAMFYFIMNGKSLFQKTFRRELNAIDDDLFAQNRREVEQNIARIKKNLKKEDIEKEKRRHAWENETINDAQEFFFGLTPEEEKQRSIEKLDEITAKLKEEVIRIKELRKTAEIQRAALHDRWFNDQYATAKAHKKLAHLFCAIDLKIKKLTNVKNRYEKNIEDLEEKLIKLKS